MINVSARFKVCRSTMTGAFQHFLVEMVLAIKIAFTHAKKARGIEMCLRVWTQLQFMCGRKRNKTSQDETSCFLNSIFFRFVKNFDKILT